MRENPMSEVRPDGGAGPRIGTRSTGRLVFGLIVITLGVLLLLDEFGRLNASEVLRWWAVVPLGYGLARLTGTGVRQQVTSGLIFTLFGGWMLLRELGVIPFGLRDFWPIIIIALGATMVSGGLRRRRPGASGDSANTLHAFAFWSGVDRKVVTPDFQGGDVTAFMGGHELDLRSAKMTEGTAIIDLFVMMGGVDMRIPEDWTVSYDGVLIMGGVEDRTRPPAGEVRGRLVLKGFVMMGGVEVKN